MKGKLSLSDRLKGRVDLREEWVKADSLTREQRKTLQKLFPAISLAKGSEFKVFWHALQGIKAKQIQQHGGKTR